MAWLNTRVTFPDRRAILTLTPHECIEFGILLEITCKSPSKIEAELRQAIAKHRPELNGCSIYLMDMDLMTQKWIVVIEHPSLDKVKLGDEVPRMPLVPETWRDREPMF